MTTRQYDSLKDFWPFYLSEHAHPVNRTLHFIGSSGVLILLALSIYTRNPWLLLVLPLCGYGFAWFGHFIIEKNRPATFKYPVKSLVSDWIMYFYILTGQIGRQLEKHNIKPVQSRAAA